MIDVKLGGDHACTARTKLSMRSRSVAGIAKRLNSRVFTEISTT
jgi:hypothetical protein